jgi:hypothetical protein
MGVKVLLAVMTMILPSVWRHPVKARPPLVSWLFATFSQPDLTPADTVRATSVPPANEHAVPTAYDLKQHEKQEARHARSRRYIRLRQRHQALSDSFRQVRC